MKRTSKPQDAQKTILVVDDDAAILSFVSELLITRNYNVIAASSGKKAAQVSRDWVHEIHLLVSDFQMPGMSGIDLAAELTLARPKLKVLLMSGFPGGMLIPNEGWHFLAKPFVPSQLRALIVGLIGNP